MLKRIGLFILGPWRLALPLPVLAKVMKSPRLFTLPLTGPWVPAVFADGRELIPVFDLQRWLGGGGEPAPKPELFVICTTEFGRIGLPLDQALGIVDEGRGNWRNADIAGMPRLFRFQENDFRLVDVNDIAHSLCCD